MFIALATVAYVEKLLKASTKELLFFLVKLFSPLVYVCTIAFVVIPIIAPSEFKTFKELLYVTSIQLLVMIILVAPMVWYGLYKTRLINDMKQYLNKRN